MSYLVAFLQLLSVSWAPNLPASPSIQKPRPKAETIIVGPFQLGQLYDDMPDQRCYQQAQFRRIRDRLEELRGPGNKEVVDSLNKCKLYVIARTTTTPGKQKEFDGSATAVVQGLLSFDLKDKKGELFQLQVRKISLTKGVVLENADPQSWTAGLRIQFRIVRNSSKDRIENVDFYTRALQFDVNGQAQWQEDDR